jgi:small subunit ribosomal protein S1
VQGEVVNIMNYGAFVKLEEGVEGLVHISEMSWTRRINHPSELVAIGDIIDVVVLDINEDKQEISLGMKQTEVNPWTLVEEKYPSGTVIKGRVRNLTNYGAFVEIEEGIDGLLHMSDMSWTKKMGHPSEILKKGDVVDAVVLSVSQEKKRVALGMKQLAEDPWEQDIPSRYQPGDVATGTVTKLTSFGAFVELEDNLEGLLHISEMADRKIESPEEIVQVGQRIQVFVLRVDTENRKIGLSLRRSKLPETEFGATMAEAVNANPPEEAKPEAEAEPEAEPEAEANAEPEAAEAAGDAAPEPEVASGESEAGAAEEPASEPEATEASGEESETSG